MDETTGSLGTIRTGTLLTTQLRIEGLPPKTTRGTIVRLLTQVGRLDRKLIGKIELSGRGALVEVPAAAGPKLAAALDGTQLDQRYLSVTWTDTGEAPAASGGEDHFQRLARLMKLEAEAEDARTLNSARRLTPEQAQQQGTALIELALVDESAGLGGRLLLKFARTDGRPLPWTRLGVGSPVVVSRPAPAGQSEGARRRSLANVPRGVISEVTETSLEVAMQRWPDAWSDGSAADREFRIDLASDLVAHERQMAALQRARTAAHERLAELRQFLLLAKPARFADPPECKWFNPRLNPSQQQAVQFALAAQDVALIHGPPGTGKTTTLVELIRQAVERGETVLACAPSNAGVDNLFERLLVHNQGVIRLGHPARVSPALRQHTLDLVVAEHRDVRLARKLVREASQLRQKAGRFTRAQPPAGHRRELHQEANQLLADARRIEAQVVREVLASAQVICATTTGLDSEILGKRTFDLCVIDEACQSVEPGCWIPLLRSERVVLAGDPFQLPPTIISGEAQKAGLSVSLLERLMTAQPDLSRRLNVQYRMHADIAQFSADEFYAGDLQPHASVAKHLLKDFRHVTADPLTSTPLRFIDTAGAGYDEEQEPDGESRLNPREAQLAARYVRSLLELGLPPGDLGVITPYAAQVRHLRQLLPEAHVHIDSVDGFQGREKEAIIISLVRSNLAGEIGFLSDVRRMNVALTRARRKLIVIGDSATIGCHDFYQRMLEHFEMLGGYHSVWEEDLD